jgi:galactonate dehydratase
MEGGSWTRWGYRRIIEDQLAQHIMPDILHCGGLSEAMRIAALAEMYGVTCSPHNVGGAPGRAATLHFAAAVPNFLSFEHLPLHLEHPPVTDVSSKPLPDVEDGYIRPPQGPGLGVDLEHVEVLAKKYPFDPSKEAPKLGLHGLNTVAWHAIASRERAFIKENPPARWRLDYS